MKIQLSGTVTDNSSANLYRRWGFTNVCCPDDIRNALDATPEDEDLELDVNSGGGSVYAGFEMYSIIRNAEKRVVANVQSIAGSAMSVIISACDEVRMSPVANIMIHRASIGYASGNAEKMEQNAQMLNTIDESILNAYCEKVGDKLSRTQIRHLMEQETFMTAQSAIDNGFADALLEDDSDSNPMQAVASMENAPQIMLAMGMQLPDITDLQKIDEEHNKQKPVERKENTMTKDELFAQYPDLCAEIASDAQNAERDRILNIEAMALPGFEQIVADAKADFAKNAADVAMAIVAQQKQAGAKFVNEVHEDAEASNVDDVDAEASENAEDENIEADVKAAVNAWKGGKN